MTPKAKQSSIYFSFPVKKLTSSGEKPHNHYRFPHTAAAADFFLKNIVNTSCVKCTYLNANDKNMRKFPLFQHLHCNALDSGAGVSEPKVKKTADVFFPV